MGYFSIAIVSDTISSLELSKHLDTLKQKDLLLIRKGNSEQLKGTDLEWMLPHIDGWVTDQMPMEEFIEEIAEMKEQIGEMKNDTSRSYKNSFPD